jgi:hypothetical protein
MLGTGLRRLALALIGVAFASALAAQPRARPAIDGIPPRIFAQMTAPKAVGYPTLAWPTRVVTVAFNGGSEPLHRLIEQVARDWARHGGGLRLSFRDRNGRFRRWRDTDRTARADIRIGFNDGQPLGGYWSVIGVSAQMVAANEPTMNFEGFPVDLARYFNGAHRAEWLLEYHRSTILHEFGHALGLAHEHYHPDCQSDLLLDAAIPYLMERSGWNEEEGRYNWTEEEARFSADAAYYFEIMEQDGNRAELSGRIDQASVMLYDFPSHLFRSGEASACRPSPAEGFATALSPMDVETYLAYYPVQARRRRG